MDLQNEKAFWNADVAMLADVGLTLTRVAEALKVYHHQNYLFLKWNKTVQIDCKPANFFTHNLIMFLFRSTLPSSPNGLPNCALLRMRKRLQI